MTVTLSEMRTTVRQMTARYTPQQMQDAQIDRYLNLFMTLKLPLHFKNLKLTKPYVFNTVPNVDTYDFVYEPNIQFDPLGNPVPGNVQIGPPAYCQGYLLRYYQDKSIFYNLWPKLTVNQIINTSDGTSGPFSGFIPSKPFYRAQVDIFGNVTEPAVVISTYDDTGFNYVITDVPQPDNNIGNLVDDENNVVGTVNYLTGAYTFTVEGGAVIPDGDTIYASVIPYQASRPTDVLFYNQQIVFRPCPMQVYQVEFQISQMPTQLIADNDFPELSEWYLFICAGASKLIYNAFPDPEGSANLDPVWQEELQLAQRRTLRQMSSQRAQTIFSTPGWSRNAAGLYLGTEYSGN